MKNTVLADPQRYIHLLGLTTQGSLHDYRLFELEFDPDKNWVIPAELLADTAYIALAKHFQIQSLLVPFKRKRKAKDEPKHELTPEQKEFNTALSRRRIRVEHAIAGMKRFLCLKQVWRGRKLLMDDLVALLCAGLWNALLRNHIS